MGFETHEGGVEFVCVTGQLFPASWKRASPENDLSVKNTARTPARSDSGGQSAETHGQQANWTLCLAVAFATILVYGRCLANDFINFDDHTYITENSHLRSGVTLETARWTLTTYYAGNWHPLTWLSHTLDVQMFGLNPVGHHSIGALFHALNGILLFLLLSSATGLRGRSLVVAALFALHPLNVECVAWAAERKSLLCALFFFLALGAYGWYAARPSRGRFALVATLFALGLMAKPMVITLPFVLLLLDYWPLRRSTACSSGTNLPTRSPGQLVVEKVPLAVLSAASGAVTLAAQRSSGAVVSLVNVPLSARIENALWAYVQYLEHAVWPAGLAVFYPRGRIQVVSVLLACLLLAAISWWAWRERTRRPYIIVGWFWYLGTMVPVIGLVQVGQQAMADRYAYIPLLGIFLILVWRFADEMEERVGFHPAVQMAVAAVLLILAGCTWRQVGWWRNSLSLWTHTISVTRDNTVAEENLATALMDVGRDEEAVVHWRNAIGIRPTEPKAHIALGALLQKHGELQPAIEQFHIALSLTQDPDDLRAIYSSLGLAYREIRDYSAAIETLRAWLKLDPSNGSTMVALGNVTLVQACDRIARELTDHPSTEAFIQLGNVCEQAGELEAARRAYRSALDLNSNLRSAREGLDRTAKSP